MLRIYHRKAFRISVTKFRPGVTEIGQNATVQITNWSYNVRTGKLGSTAWGNGVIREIGHVLRQAEEKWV